MGGEGILSPREVSIDWFQQLLERDKNDYLFEKDDGDSDGIVSWCVDQQRTHTWVCWFVRSFVVRAVPA